VEVSRVDQVSGLEVDLFLSIAHYLHLLWLILYAVRLLLALPALPLLAEPGIAGLPLLPMLGLVRLISLGEFNLACIGSKVLSSSAMTSEGSRSMLRMEEERRTLESKMRLRLLTVSTPSGTVIAKFGVGYMSFGASGVSNYPIGIVVFTL
jgi:hypothetical protein